MRILTEKVCTQVALLTRLDALPRPLVFTNGVFDMLHRAHVNYLHQAAALGGSLIVAVNPDASARMLGKGPDRPLRMTGHRHARQPTRSRQLYRHAAKAPGSSGELP